MHIMRYAVDGDVLVAVRDATGIRPLPARSVADLLTLPLSRLRDIVEAAAGSQPVTGPADEPRPLPPVDGLTEVWASGVTYRRSSDARQEESQVADVYARVYEAARPELFFKSPAWRVCGHGEPIDGLGTLSNPVRAATAAEFGWLTPDPARGPRRPPA